MRLDESGDLFDPDDDDRPHPGRLPPGAMWTGIDLLDTNARGLQPTDVFLVAAPPGVGTTSLLLVFARYLSLTNDCRTLLASASEPSARIAQRFLAAESGVPPDGTTGALDDRSRQRRRQARRRLAGAQLTVATDLVDRRGLLNLAGSGRFDALVLDDLSAFDAMSPRPDGTNRPTTEAAPPRHILRDLKAMALRAGIAVVAGVSLPACSADDLIELIDLKPAGLVDAADVIVTLRRVHDEPELLDAGIVKNRKGPSGVTDRLAIFPDRSTVTNLARHHGNATA